MLTANAVVDRYPLVTPPEVRAAAFQVINRIQQHEDPAVQVMATAVALCAMVESCGIRMRDVICAAERLLADAEGPHTEHIQAIRAYAQHEILRRGT